MNLYYRIAGLTVKMDSFGRIIRQAEPYRIDEPDHVDVEIHSLWPEAKARNSHLSDSDGEYLGTGGNFHHQLLNFDGMMLHSSAVVVDGRAYLFTANSGTGKSTHTGLWLKYFGEKAFVLNDDKPALRLEDGVWYAYGTPWSGKHDISANVRVPLAGIAVLERSGTNSIARFEGVEAVHALYRQISAPKELEPRMKLLELLDKLYTQIPVWKLKCNMELEAVEVAYGAMSGKEE